MPLRLLLDGSHLPNSTGRGYHQADPRVIGVGMYSPTGKGVGDICP